ncbi:hypothetical protein [Bradyrhizobium sp.]|uniref:hypothetical protein n=1 Tax=Bradyrhizobium sp. TaxID=376 RepID=UPI00262AD045|nr:hypothetical protein [Bradyrhizobium sp.]
MQVDSDVAAVDVALISDTPSNQQADPDADNERAVVANDNGKRWPPIAFPEDWYASF